MNVATEAEIGALLKVIDPDDDATGGGTASAVAGSLAAGLTGMVARVSRGRADMEPESFYDRIDLESRQHARFLMAGGLRDSKAFGAVMAAYRMPKQTEEDKAARSRAIQAGLAGATAVPLENGERCAQVLELVNALRPRHNTNASSDLEVAGRLARAALDGCIDNAEINLGSLKDESVRRDFEERLGDLRSAVRTTGAGGVSV